ncbi:BLUF domain-containing protein [Sphingomonas immobilis]|uniref:BLUF domain-containing protein n=1 Tax=Sphingomonas immobilis TaxID=3063997 RepID=A0ABT8ZWM2_9SPHN|nr:BLUF domain-containing protein [Sphingomonas sp. CA1-15]MDO7841961.1 BLUF domain-containing protein [Sphingomonas sp. CA1-15]
MLQIVYISSALSSVTNADVSSLLARSRTNNQRDGITGLLFFNGQRFLQALEGPDEHVERTIAKIATDPRHRALVTLSRRTIVAREFGDWAMASFGPLDRDGKVAIARIDTLTAQASPNVRALFTSYARLRAA